MADYTTATTRRAFVTTGALVALAGCATAQLDGGGNAGSSGPVSVLAAGSLQSAFENGLRAAVEERIDVEAYGSTRAARLVKGGQRDPDVLALADTSLFGTLLDAPWYAAFATNAVVLAYNSKTAAGRRVGDADPWYEPLTSGDVRLGRTDPNLDPLGYRTRFVLELAAAHYDEPALPDEVLGKDQLYPETQLLAGFESGQLDAAFVYRSMAVEHGYDYVDLPAAIDLSDPARASQYASVSETLSDGTVVHGGLVEYGALLRTPGSRPARDVFRTMVEDGHRYLDSDGFVVPNHYPRYEGDVPNVVRG